MEVPDKFNPLDSMTIARSIALALHDTQAADLSDLTPFSGAGIYAIFYKGDLDVYSPIASAGMPIYVGKAVSPGSRKIGCNIVGSKSSAVYTRLQDHAGSIAAVGNLTLDDFAYKALMLDDMWISVAEAYLIQRHRPLWNMVLEGFGNHDPGKGRYKQQRSLWDTIHPARPWSLKLEPNTKKQKEIFRIVENHLTEQPLRAPK